MGVMSAMIAFFAVLAMLSVSAGVGGGGGHKQGEGRKDIWIASESKAKLKAEWDHGYATGFWNSMSEAPVERARSAIIAGFYFQKLFGSSADGTFLDVGGGEGVMSDYLSAKQKARYTGVDISEAGIKMGRQKRPGIEFVVSPAEDFNKDKKRSFHFILFSEMIYYCKHKEVFAQYQQYLQPSGVIALSVWFRDNHPSATMGPAVFKDAQDMMTLIDSMYIRGNTFSYQTNVDMPAGFHVGIFKPNGSTIDVLAANQHTGHLAERLRSAIVSGTYYQKYVAAALPVEKFGGGMLDIGCKEGGQLVYLLPQQRAGYVGVDTEAAVAAARGRVSQGGGGNVTFVAVKHASEYTPTSEFSMIVFNEMIYKEDHKKMLTKYKAFLEPGGYLVLCLAVTTVGPERDASVAKRTQIFADVSQDMELVDSFSIEEEALPGVVRTSPLVDLKVGIFQVTRTWKNLVRRVDDVASIINRKRQAGYIPSILSRKPATTPPAAPAVATTASAPPATTSSSSSSSSSWFGKVF